MAGYGKAQGRKTKEVEIAIFQRYADLSEPAFVFLHECLTGKNKADRKWAVEQLSKGFTKMIPQVIEGNKDKPIPILNVSPNVSYDQDTSPQKADTSSTGGHLSQ